MAGRQKGRERYIQTSRHAIALRQYFQQPTLRENERKRYNIRLTVENVHRLHNAVQENLFTYVMSINFFSFSSQIANIRKIYLAPRTFIGIRLAYRCSYIKAKFSVSRLK